MFTFKDLDLILRYLATGSLHLFTISLRDSFNSI